MAVVVKISRPGFSVLTAADSELSLSSELPMLKIAEVVTISVVVPQGGSGSTSYAHGLGYEPAFMAFWNFSAAIDRRSPAFEEAPFFFIRCNSTNIIVIGADQSGFDSGTFTFRVVIFRESLP